MRRKSFRPSLPAFLLFLLTLVWGGALQAQPMLVTDPANGGTLEFGNVPVGVSSVMQVAVTNGGTGNLTQITEVLTTDTVFKITSENCSTDGAPCTVEITFTPTATGLVSDTLTIDANNNNPDVPSIITVQGTGTDAVAGSIEPTDHDFGQIGIGQVSDPPQTFTVTSLGTLSLDISSVTLSDLINFSIDTDGCTGSSLNQSETCEVAVVCNPASEAIFNATLTIDATGLASPLVANLTCEGIPVPLISANPTELNFGSVEETVTSSPQQVTLTNTGTADLNIGTLGISGTDPSNFAISTDNCSGMTVIPANTCSFEVTFTPPASGDFSAQVDVPSDAANEPALFVPLMGTGISATDPVIQISPAGPVDFGNVGVGNSSPVVNFTVTNIGGSLSTLNLETLNIADSGNFLVSNDNCSDAELAQNEDCTVGVAFAPQGAGVINGTLNVPNDAVSGPDSAALTGTGVSPSNPVLSAEPTTVNFGNVTVNATANQTVTVKNTGDAALEIGEAEITGNAAFSFNQDNCSGVTLLTNETCTIVLAVLSGQAGQISGTLTIPSNDPLGPALVALLAAIVSQDGGGCSLTTAAVPVSHAGGYALGILALGGFAWLRSRRR